MSVELKSALSSVKTTNWKSASSSVFIVSTRSKCPKQMWKVLLYKMLSKRNNDWKYVNNVMTGI